MKEIELKAHVNSRKNVTETLNKIAKYLGSASKEDFYYSIPLAKCENSKDFVTVRIRKEIFSKFPLNSNESKTDFVQKIYMTYKSKEVNLDSNGNSLEVNEENECQIDNLEALEKLFFSLGAKITLQKQKFCEQWNYFKNDEILHAELCEVPPLGDFLEIEVIKDKASKKEIEKIRKLEQNLLEECKIPLNQIESKYYKTLLEEYKK